jgi:hypothetical protein
MTSMHDCELIQYVTNDRRVYFLFQYNPAYSVSTDNSPAYLICLDLMILLVCREDCKL